MVSVVMSMNEPELPILYCQSELVGPAEVLYSMRGIILDKFKESLVELKVKLKNLFEEMPVAASAAKAVPPYVVPAAPVPAVTPEPLTRPLVVVIFEATLVGKKF